VFPVVRREVAGGGDDGGDVRVKTAEKGLREVETIINGYKDPLLWLKEVLQKGADARGGPHKVRP